MMEAAGPPSTSTVGVVMAEPTDGLVNMPPLQPKARDPETDSTSSLVSLLPPPTPFKKALVWLIFALVLTTIAQLIVCCVYTGIAGNSGYYYNHPHSWEFCLIYADQTIQRYDQKLLDGVTLDLPTLGLMNCIYAWMALAACFRALYHFEWIPSSIVFTIFNAFGQICYYQSTNLIIVPAKLVTSLAAVTKWVTWDMYKNLGYFCFHIELHAALNIFGVPFPLVDTVIDESIQEPNCTDAVVILSDDIQDLGTLDQLTAIANSTVPNSELNCEGAVWLHVAFLICNYFFVAITVISLIVLIIGDREIRRKHPVRHFLERSGHGDSPEDQDLRGDRLAMVCCFFASMGYFITSVSLCHASMTTLDSIKNWQLIDINMQIQTQEDQYSIDLDADVEFYVQSWLPFKNNFLDLQTVMLMVATMAVIRGSYKQSISAFRLAAVASLLGAIIQLPPIIGNYETFNVQHLWWWQSTEHCNHYFSGKAFYYPDEDQSRWLCRDARSALFGALLQFVFVTINIFACCRVYSSNIGRISLAMRFSAEAPVDFAGAELMFDVYADDELSQQQSTQQSPLINAEYEPTNTQI